MNVNGNRGMMSQTQMGSVEIKDYDDSTFGQPKIWYEDIYRLAMKASSKETMTSVASAIRGLVQQKTDENAAMTSNAMPSAFASTVPLMKTKVTVLGFSYEGKDIHTTSETIMSELFPKGAVFQVKIQYDIQVGDGGGSNKGKAGSVPESAPDGSTLPVLNDPNVDGEGPITFQGAGCCTIL